MKKIIGLFILLSSISTMAQSTELPILTYKGTDLNKPLIFYISGDGGWNTFSTTLMKGFTKAGYSVIGLNAKSYFWTRKKPEQAAGDVSRTINEYVKNWNIKSIVLVGYSFGADVAPFIQTRFPANITALLIHTFLMSPSKKTDFEVHVLGMMGLGNSSGQSVSDEINKLLKPTTLIFGSDENDFPIKTIRLNNIETIRLAGGHHYDGNVDEVVKQITDKIK